jgi:poly [ADP-ribose] polymerase
METDTQKPEVVYFLNLISNENIINNILKNMNIDKKLMPVEKINKKRLKRSNEILSILQNEVNNNNLSNTEALSKEYDLYIPYVIPSVLNNLETINKHLENMEIIENMYETYETIIKTKKNNIGIMKYYHVLTALNIKMDILANGNLEFEEIMDNIAENLKHKHKDIRIYKISNDEKKQEYNNITHDIKDKRLLYHGSPVTNWFSIIRNGLYINPKKIGVSINGKACGNGIYFSNDINYSYGYSQRKNFGNVIIMGIYEVALCDKSYKSNSIFVLFNTKQCLLKYLLLLA